MKRLKMLVLATAAAAVFSVSVAGTANAVPIYTAYTSIRPDGIGNQGYGGILGNDFDVLAPIRVTELGAFDHLQNGIAGTINVGIFDRNTKSLVGNTAAISGNIGLDGQSQFFDIADFILSIGNYSIVAYGFNNTDKNGNITIASSIGTRVGPAFDTGGGLISAVGVGRWTNSASFVWPTSTYASAATFDTGTFKFEDATAVPEPSTIAIFGMGLLGFGLVGSRRRRKAKA